MGLWEDVVGLFQGQQKGQLKKSGGSSALDKFLDGASIDPGSSYAAEWWYEREQQVLVTRYRDGAVWSYHPVSESMATDFFLAPSKGRWMWNNVRKRGTRTQHQVGAARNF